MRITTKDLENSIDRLNQMAGSPPTPWTKTASGKLVANIGNYHLGQSYGGYRVERMHGKHGGITTPISSAYATKRECYEMLRAYINGAEAAKGE